MTIYLFRYSVSDDESSAVRKRAIAQLRPVVFVNEHSWEVVYQTYSKKGRIDPAAPVRARGEIEIVAPIATVWSVLTDVGAWPSIRSDISDVEPTPASQGRSFTWSTSGIRLLSRFGRVDPLSEVAWITTAPGLVMTHVYKLERVSQGVTVLRCEEAMDAPAAPHIGNDELRGRIGSWLSGIKAVAEAQFETKGVI